MAAQGCDYMVVERRSVCTNLSVGTDEIHIAVSPTSSEHDKLLISPSVDPVKRPKHYHIELNRKKAEGLIDLLQAYLVELDGM